MAHSRRLQVLVTIAVLVTAALVAFTVAPGRHPSPRPAREAGEPDATAVQPTVTPATAGAAQGVVPSAAPAAPPAAAPRAATPQPAPPVGHLPLHSEGGKLIDADGQEVRLTGVNWFGLETGTFAPHGLWARNWQEMLDQIAASGFNTIRLPYSNQLFDPSSKPTSKDAGGGIDYTKNPDLAGLSGLEIMDRIIAGAGQRGLT